MEKERTGAGVASPTLHTAETSQKHDRRILCEHTAAPLGSRGRIAQEVMVGCDE